MLILLLVFRYDWTPLHRSAECGNLEVCRLLLQSGADVNAKDK
jgi:ankyrin repeat protein